MPKVVKPLKIKKQAKIDKVKALVLKAKGVSNSDIANTFGCTVNAVQKSINPLMQLLTSDDNLIAYRKKEIDILDSIKGKFLLESVNPKKLKSASSLQCMTAYCQAFDKVRLLEGKSTANINNQSIISMALDTMKDIRNKLDNAQIIDSDTPDNIIGVDK
jgi:hypothetical protein